MKPYRYNKRICLYRNTHYKVKGNVLARISKENFRRISRNQTMTIMKTMNVNIRFDHRIQALSTFDQTRISRKSPIAHVICLLRYNETCYNETVFPVT